MRSQLIAQGNGHFALSGVLDFGTVPKILHQSQRQFAAQRPVVIDLGAVSAANSAGLALLLEWLADARASGCPVRFTGLPPSLVGIARICGVEGWLLGEGGQPDPYSRGSGNP